MEYFQSKVQFAIKLREDREEYITQNKSELVSSDLKDKFIHLVLTNNIQALKSLLEGIYFQFISESKIRTLIRELTKNNELHTDVDKFVEQYLKFGEYGFTPYVTM